MILGIKSMIGSIISIAIFGSIVWGHHMYVVGMEIENKIYFTNLSLLISLP
jgi:heme/copper-type cytochrome/quinol oxidase subunit 1